MTEDITFALDIGTRTIVGILVKKNKDSYEIIHSAVREHQTRAMLDGQIHNVSRVVEVVRELKDELESKSGLTLKKTAVAAAGRALKTITENHKLSLEKNRYIEEEDLKTLELEAVQKAQKKLGNLEADKKTAIPKTEIEDSAKNRADYHFVGYTVRKYSLDGMEIGDLIGQKGKNMEVELVATFLPKIVIDSLFSVINRVGLEVEHLTLEPIAASQVVIPESMSNFNLALVDIGAGTSDIAITKGGSISGYAMVPIAGDEITEIISEKFLVDYNKAEKLKCNLAEEELLEVDTILGEKLQLKKDDILEAAAGEIDKLCSHIADKILEINSTPPQAVIFIGGGSLIPGLKENFAQKMDIIESRIGIRKREDLQNISGEIKGVNTTQTLTPIGIAVITRETKSRAVFIDVEINDTPINLLTLSQPTCADALLAADISIESIRPRPGRGITAVVNGDLKIVKGELGSSAEIMINGKKASLKEKLSSGDSIKFSPGRPGTDAEAKIIDLIPEEDICEYDLYLNGSKNKLYTKIFQNGKLVNYDQDLIDGAEIEYTVPKTVRDGLAQIMDLTADKLNNESIVFTFNGQEERMIKSNYFISSQGKELDLDSKLTDNLQLEIEEKEKDFLTIKDLLQKKGSREIKFYFNNSQLEIPEKQWEVTVNGKKENLNYKIEAGDQIKAKSHSLTIKDLFRYINYEITEKMKDKIQLILNGSKVGLAAEIKEDDKLKVKLS